MIQSSGKPEGVPRWAKSPGRKPRAFAVFSGLLLLGRAGEQSLQALGKVQLAQLQELADGVWDRGGVCAAVRLQEGLWQAEQHGRAVCGKVQLGGNGVARGADGGIGGTYAVMPELFLKMDALCRENDFAAAAPIQHSVNTIIEAMCACRGNLYAVIKKIIELREGLPLGGVRPPMPNLEAEDMAQVHVCAEMIDAAIKSFA